MSYQQPNPTYSAPTSTMAVISLVAGILGFTMFPFLGSIIALITGYMARGETRGNPPTHSGDGMATAGIVMGWIGVGLGVCGICAGIAFFMVPFFLVLLGVAVEQSALPVMLLV